MLLFDVTTTFFACLFSKTLFTIGSKIQMKKNYNDFELKILFQTRCDSDFFSVLPKKRQSNQVLIAFYFILFFRICCCCYIKNPEMMTVYLSLWNHEKCYLKIENIFKHLFHVLFESYMASWNLNYQMCDDDNNSCCHLRVHHTLTLMMTVMMMTSHIRWIIFFLFMLLILTVTADWQMTNNNNNNNLNRDVEISGVFFFDFDFLFDMHSWALCFSFIHSK